jgi:hypothetical protein
MDCIWQNLPHDLHALIIAQISNFKLWCNARFVSRKWLELILEDQDKKVWRFVKFYKNAFLLPNNVMHGIHEAYGRTKLYKFGRYFGETFENNRKSSSTFKLILYSDNAKYYEYKNTNIDVWIDGSANEKILFSFRSGKMTCEIY